ncbi:hypothetical protein P5757_26790 [Bacillus tropicus]|uniref:hypothetical protein n=1 Tax=Bacillus tropicus TaxID=2026188 RepID=UPI000775BE65|nr:MULTISPECIES: hypothetical protein [Terrabacteria group]KXO02945.1 hypothetical protein AYK81_03600 [Bacillus thuringiensis]PES89643.1 hypothetical protein CN504_00070 [Bacillus anthracis]MCU5003636.1 hypothetical protein [Bacillus tropicus]MDF9556791.1 hypothetical protein [Bacillus tropicus]MDF9592338.1 hypothetical protein [Bacillus tropicus]
MKSKGVLISFLVLVTFLGFLPIEKASASVSSNSVNEVEDRIDTSKNYYIVPADLPTRGLGSHRSLNFLPSLVVAPSLGNTVEKPNGARMKLVFSEEKKKYQIGMPYPMPGRGLVNQFIQIIGEGSLYISFGDKYGADWIITPVEGGYILQAEGGYLNYKDIESSMYGPITRAYLGKEKVVWKLVPVL